MIVAGPWGSDAERRRSRSVVHGVRPGRIDPLLVRDQVAI
ncbi:hypothetical protein GFS60_06956 (plasmid) [Rhodococcus sp. WAY2]|nr:hypothetical protein GFS60_06956 [Rhodococcus sp. WAY2]